MSIHNSPHKIRNGGSDRLFTIINYTIVTIIFLVVLYPVVYLVSASVTDPVDVSTGKMWLWPTSLTLEAYKLVFRTKMIWLGYRNTILYAVVGTFLSVFVTMFGAYALSRKDLVGRNLLTFIFTFTMFFSGGMIPTYLVVRSLHIINTPLSMILPNMLSIWNLIITRTFIQSTIPPDMLEAAKIDGCSDIKYFWKIVMPLSGTIIAVITLFYAVGIWNQYFNAMLYINDKALYPLTMVLRDLLVKNDITEAGLDAATQQRLQLTRDLLKYALIVVSSVPMLIIYPFIQKNFVKGVMVGSIKG